MTAASKAVAQYLVSPGTLVERPGSGAPFELGGLAGLRLLLVLRIEDIIEQEALHVSVWGSADGTNWGAKPLFWYPERFYRGATPAALDLGQRPEVRFLQARWGAQRWGRGYPLPHFKFSLEIQELEQG
jgi:hypothetical protein